MVVWDCSSIIVCWLNEFFESIDDSSSEIKVSFDASALPDGTSPIPASSGRQGSRHRLNRGGDRQANRAIHDIVRARMSSDERTKAYIAAKRAEGKTVREAVRCLCRFVAREVYRLLTGPQEPLPDGAALAARRRAAGLRQADVSAALGLVGNKVSRLERGITVDGPALREYDRYLSALEAENAGKAH